MPFYRFGEILCLEKIAESHWVPFIIERFKATNKKILEKLAIKITQQIENHSYYIHQLSQVVWQQTIKVATEESLYEAIEGSGNAY